MSSGGTVRYEVDGHIAVLTLDRPEHLNAFTDEMETDLLACFDKADADHSVRAVVLTGSGRAFCAGMDLSEAAPEETFERWRSSPSATPGTQYAIEGELLPLRVDGGGRVSLRIFDSLHPVVVAINGHATGVGITMTLAADVRVVSAGAKIAFPFTQRGFAPESCSSWFLPRIVGISQALDWMLSGRTFDAAEALRGGLVRSVQLPQDTLPVAMEIARSFIEGTAPVSVTLARRMLWHMLTVGHPSEAHAFETVVLNKRGVSVDAHEGVSAFLERRRPIFDDRASEAERALIAGISSPPVQWPDLVRRGLLHLEREGAGPGRS